MDVDEWMRIYAASMRVVPWSFTASSLYEMELFLFIRRTMLEYGFQRF